MYLYRTIHNSFQSTRSLPWISLMEISQQDILEITQDETMAVEISQHQFNFCQEANGQFCNIYAPLQLLANPPSCITALHAKNAATISIRCSLQIRKTQNISIPVQIAPNMWILTTASSTVTNSITLICPVLCKAVWYYCSFLMCLGVILLHLYMYKSCVLQYTTAHLQVLFSS